MQKLVTYIKTHKLTVVLLILVTYFIFRTTLFSSMYMLSTQSTGYNSKGESSFQEMALPFPSQPDVIPGTTPTYESPMYDAQARKVVTNSNYSLLVTNVSDSIESIQNKVTSVAGYVIDVNIRRGETSEHADISLRVPTNRVEEVTKHLRAISAKVVSENISGTDITSQYEDVETRIAELQNVKTKLEQIMDNAITSDEMLRVFNQITTITTQIDNYKGKLKYMDSSSSTSKLTVSLSTDELALPYAPKETWRPEVIFKTAVRSLLSLIQSLGTLLIWLAVYTPLIVLVVIIVLLIKKRRTKV